MKVALDKVFPLDATAESAWQLLQDIETVAGCMPGAKITERIDETHYKGTITVRLGPATMAFKGEIEVLNLDPAVRSLHMVGKGSDTTGTSRRRWISPLRCGPRAPPANWRAKAKSR